MQKGFQSSYANTYWQKLKDKKNEKTHTDKKPKTKKQKNAYWQKPKDKKQNNANWLKIPIKYTLCAENQ